MGFVSLSERDVCKSHIGPFPVFPFGRKTLHGSTWLAWKEDGHRTCLTQLLLPLIALLERQTQQEDDHTRTGRDRQGEGQCSKQEDDKAAC
jgi:hypothetical protein